MTFSYDPSISSTVDQIRLQIGDVDSGDQQLQDEEIEFLLTQDPNPLDCAIAAADVIAARYTRMIDIAIGPARQQLMQLQTSYEKLADRLRKKIARRGILPVTGGISLAARDLALEDTDLVQPEFRRGQMEERGTGFESVDPDFAGIFPWI